MRYSFSVDGRSIPIEGFHGNRPVGTDPFMGSVSLKEQGRLEQEASDSGLRPDTQVKFTAAERIPNGTRGAILQDETPLHTVVVSGASQASKDFDHVAVIVAAAS